MRHRQGTSGCGKSTFGAALAQSLAVPFVDGDDLHPDSNVQKMSRNEPLTDEDRLPWLLRIREKAIQLTHPIHSQAASDRELSSRDEVRPAEAKVREMAEVLETSHQGKGEPRTEGSGSIEDDDRRGNDTSRNASLTRACVIACSALKRSYRDLLRGKQSSDLHVVHVYLEVSEEELKRRMHARKDHFMKETMLASQLATLESPKEEPDVITMRGGKVDEEVQWTKEQIEKMLS
jgi:gluconokinase